MTFAILPHNISCDTGPERWCTFCISREGKADPMCVLRIGNCYNTGGIELAVIVNELLHFIADRLSRRERGGTLSQQELCGQ